MSIQGVILLAIGLLAVGGAAWALETIAKKAGAPDQPTRMIIWGLAFLIALLIVLRAFGVLNLGI